MKGRNRYHSYVPHYLTPLYSFKKLKKKQKKRKEKTSKFQNIEYQQKLKSIKKLTVNIQCNIDHHIISIQDQLNPDPVKMHLPTM